MIFAELAVIWDEEPHAAALNMALDEVLLREAKVPALRFYRWAAPAVSFGYFGKLAEVEEAWAGQEPVRRWTGGGIVPHGEDFTYSLVVPREHAFARLGAAESYRWIHAAVAQALREVEGEGVTLALGTARRVSGACFENPAESDVLRAGKKVAGAAQRRTTGGLLHQGSVQVVAAHLEFGRLLAAGLAQVGQGRGLTRGELESGRALAGEKYGTAGWLRRF